MTRSAKALIYHPNQLKVSETMSGGNSDLECAIMKAWEVQHLICEKIRIIDKRFRDHENLLRRN
jgi:hypothetical protein